MQVNLNVRRIEEINILLNILLIMDGQSSPRDWVDLATFCERDMLSNCDKHKPDVWWLVIFFLLFTSRNERFR